MDYVFKHENIKTVLDLGCGDGRSIEKFKFKKSDFIWIGVDIPSSPEVDKRVRNDGNFASYDGVNLPFLSNTFI